MEMTDYEKFIPKELTANKWQSYCRELMKLELEKKLKDAVDIIQYFKECDKENLKND